MATNQEVVIASSGHSDTTSDFTAKTFSSLQKLCLHSFIVKLKVVK